MLEKWLRDTGTTQVEFGKRIGVSQSTVSDWLSGNIAPSVESLRQIRAATGLTFDQLLNGKKAKVGDSGARAAMG